MLFLIIVVEINSLIFFSFQYDFQFMEDIVLHGGMYDMFREQNAF